MGRPYSTELSKLSETYSWALQEPIDSLVAAVSASTSIPLVAVGSGGSFTMAHFAGYLHQHYTGMVSRPVTPLELISSSINLRSLSLMILSAGGSNSDILAASKSAVSREPRSCTVLCLRKGSPLSRLAQSYLFVNHPNLTSPPMRDGFLSTNSLLAFSVLLVRAYVHALSAGDILPRQFDDLLAQNQLSQPNLQDLYKSCLPLWKRDTLVVLYGPSVSSAAFDLESKFSEAALGNVQMADFRNFAHGRHHWLAKHDSKTGILAIFANDDRDLAERTLRLIPPSIPVARVFLPTVGVTSSIAALVAVLYLVGEVGKQRGIDPGRPGVPMFGRRIYGLRTFQRRSNLDSSPELVAISRKLTCDTEALHDRQDFTFWQEAYRRFVKSFDGKSFGALLLDYDGTLCDQRDRFSGLREDIIRHLKRLLSSGIVLGIATGRGTSVRESLRRSLPQRFWSNVYLGYYNGADVAGLSDDKYPDSSAGPSEPLKIIAEAISKHPMLSTSVTFEPRRAQISIQPRSPVSSELMWRILQQLAEVKGLKAVRSSHSIDILEQNVSKRFLVDYILKLIPKDTHPILIGDKGQWPGNDYDFLSEPFSLSVDEVSADPNTCWNLAPPGYKGVQATLAYLDALRVLKVGFTFDINKVLPIDTSQRIRV